MPGNEPRRDAAPPPTPPPWLGPVKVASGVMGVMIIVGVVVLVGTIASRLSGDAEPPPTAAASVQPMTRFGETELTVPAGARIVDWSLDGGRLVVWFRSESNGSSWFQVIGLESGEVLGRVSIAPEGGIGD